MECLTWSIMKLETNIITHGDTLSEGFSVRPYRSSETIVPGIDQSLGKASSALREGTASSGLPTICYPC